MDKLKLVNTQTKLDEALSSSASPSFRELFDELRVLVEKRLTELAPDANAVGLEGAVRHGLLSPGKRLRPLITLLTCRQCGGDPLDALDAACAVEMIHGASLIIDDLPCMDDASTRRNHVATHVAYGEGVGILAAITLVNEAFGTLSRMQRTDHHKRITATEKLSNAIGLNGLAAGQERDIAPADANGGMQDVEQTHFEKTGALFAAAAGIGAVLAGARPVEIEAMESFGSALGLAYQTFDDVIDAQCSESETGKDSGQDENKTTVVTLIGAQQANMSAEQWTRQAVMHAQKVDCGAGAPLADLALLIEAKFNALTNDH